MTLACTLTYFLCSISNFVPDLFSPCLCGIEAMQPRGLSPEHPGARLQVCLWTVSCGWCAFKKFCSISVSCGDQHYRTRRASKTEYNAVEEPQRLNKKKCGQQSLSLSTRQELRPVQPTSSLYAFKSQALIDCAVTHMASPLLSLSRSTVPALCVGTVTPLRKSPPTPSLVHTCSHLLLITGGGTKQSLMF